MNNARAVWLRLETIHAVTYFGPETAAAANALGLPGFWRGYFGFRAAPMGVVSRGVVEAVFYNFAPSFVERWVPDVWERAAPADLLSARAQAAGTSLRRHPEAQRTADLVNPRLIASVARGVGAGRPLFAANQMLALPEDPVEELWQLCTCLREHRGDGHVAALTTAGIDGLEAHVLIAAEQGTPVEDLQKARGWTGDDWATAVGRCAARGLLDDAGSLTSRGRELRTQIEDVTDQLALAPFGVLDAADQGSLIRALDPLARAVSASGVIRYPNPMGLPAFV